MIAKLFTIALGACLLASCVEPPANHIKITNPKWTLDITNPKNTTAEGFDAQIETNGAVRVRFNRLSSTNDPQVVSKTAAGQALLIRETGNAVNNAFTNGIKAAKESQGMP